MEELPRKFWSGENFGPGDQNSRKIWFAGLLFSENIGPHVEKWSECKYFDLSTSMTHICVSVCIVSESLKSGKLLELLIRANRGSEL